MLAELAGREGLSASELHATLGDVPLASLYRHLDELLDAGIVGVGETRDARGPTERVFTLRRGTPQDDVLEKPANALRVFTAFCGMMVGQFSRYLRAASRNGVRPVFRGWPVYADDAEFQQLTASLLALAERAHHEPDHPGRTRRFVYLVTVPEA